MTETQAIAKWKKATTQPGDFVQKIHGGRFQEGMPDILVISKGKTMWFEFKVVDGLSLPWSKCRLAQHLTMVKMEKAGADVKYVVYSKKTERFYYLPVSIVKEDRTTQLPA